jgi:hypothetical protein
MLDMGDHRQAVFHTRKDLSEADYRTLAASLSFPTSSLVTRLEQARWRLNAHWRKNPSAVTQLQCNRQTSAIRSP